MATTYKVLGQINPTANTATTLYTVPAATQTVVSTIAVCNQSANASTFSIAVQPAGAALAAKHYLNYQTPIPGNDSITITIGLTMATTDVLSANVGSGTISIHAYGSELT
jgi:hypothetical protein